MILSDQPDTHWIFIGCIHWSAWKSIQYCRGDTIGLAGYPLNIHWRVYRSAWQSIQYCLDDTVGSAGYSLNIHCVYPLVRLTVHPILSGWYCWISRIPTEYSLEYLLISLRVHPILSGWYCRISRILTEYSLVYLLISLTVYPILSGWYVGSAGYPLNIHWCIYWSAWQSIQYCLDDTVGSAGYLLNIHWVYPLVRLTVYSILSGWYCRISRIPIEYSLSVSSGEQDSSLNTDWMILSD